MDLNDILSHLKRIESDPNVTLTTNVVGPFHDASPIKEYLNAALNEAKGLLEQHYDKRTATAVVDRTRKLISNLRLVDDRPGLAVFTNAKHGKVVHLPFRVQERVTVGSSFFTRELLRAGLDSISYHVLLLGADHARLFEAQDAHLLHEAHGAFPVRNEHASDAPKESASRSNANAELHYHKTVDAAVQEVVGLHGMVVAACAAKRYRRYMKAVADRGLYLMNLPGLFEHVAERELIAIAWEFVHTEQKRRHLVEFARMVNTAPRISNKVNEIWEQVREGRGRVLFVERDKHQPAVLEEGHAILVSDRTNHIPGIDLIDMIIEEQLGHGGEIRIVPNGTLEEFGGIALKPHY